MVAAQVRVIAGLLTVAILAGPLVCAPSIGSEPRVPLGAETEALAPQNPPPAQAAEVQAAGAPVAPPLSHAPSVFRAEQLDQLLAPIALYPDPLLAQVLMAATYPLEIVRARRWLEGTSHADLRGTELAAALAAETWDPSVKALVAFPPILHMMDDRLTWTEQLGNAFLAQQGDVMDAIQRLRQQAAAAGTLWSNDRQRVTAEGQGIGIEPTNPALIYPPVYNPGLVYGPWPAPDYPPLDLASADFDIAPSDYDIGFGLPYGIGFGAGFVVIQPCGCAFDWTRRKLFPHVGKFDAFNRDEQEQGAAVWRHDPAHRHGVPYRDFASRERFGSFRDQPVSVAALPRAETQSLPAFAPTIYRGLSPRAYTAFGSGVSARTYAQRSDAVSRMNAPRMLPSTMARQTAGWVPTRAAMASGARVWAGGARFGSASHH